MNDELHTVEGVVMPPAPARRALLIGITDYTHVKPLIGCLNDVRLMHDVLRDIFGFPDAAITVLENAHATREGILAAWDALIAATGHDDIVVIHYSGHGAQMTDADSDEGAGLDSTIVPIDSEGWQGDNRDIADDEIAAFLERLGEKTRFITLIFDCCHSGTISRDIFGARGRSIPPDLRPRPRRASTAPKLTAARGPSGWLPITEKYVVISGCRDSEIAGEYLFSDTGSQVAHGALTHALAGELRKAVPGTTYRDVFERAAAIVTSLDDTQHPQMEGRADREIFGTRDITPARFLRVERRDGTAVTLAAGMAQGVTVGSRYALYTQGTKDPAAATSLGSVEITALGATSATGRITAEAAPDSVTADTRAFETHHAFGDFAAPIAFDASAGSAAAPLAALLEASSLLKLVAPGPSAVATIHLLPQRGTPASDAFAARAGARSEPMWAVTGRSGDLLMPLKRLDDIAVIRTNLEKRARHHQALTLDNPDPGSRMRGKFTLDLLKRNADGTWVDATPESDGGYVVFREGDVIGFRIGSTHDATAQLALLDFDMSGAISVLRPSRASGTAQEPIGANLSFTIGPAFKVPPTVEWDPTFPEIDSTDGARSREALAAVKLFVTEQPADFTLLAQEGMRSAALTRASTPLGDLLQSSFHGRAMRSTDAPTPAMALSEDWTTVTRPYLIRRKTTT